MADRPRLLDLFSGAGGAGEGYHRAGFEVVGVDIEPQPNYPHEFRQGDVLEVLADEAFMRSFTVIHASPPCPRFSAISMVQGKAFVEQQPSYLWRVRRALRNLKLPYVIENVPGAPLVRPATLCGTAFHTPLVPCWDGVIRQLQRHRLFESSLPLAHPPSCNHAHPALGVYGRGGPRKTPRADGGSTAYQGYTAEMAAAMEIDWMMYRRELTNAIPPVYTEWIGVQLMWHLEQQANEGIG